MNSPKANSSPVHPAIFSVEARNNRAFLLYLGLRGLEPAHFALFALGKVKKEDAPVAPSL